MNVKKLFKIQDVGNVKPYYEIKYEMDTNDSDYVDETLIFDDIFKFDEFIFYVIAYLAKGTGWDWQTSKMVGKFNNDWNDGAYGRHIADNKDLPFLHEFIENNDLILCSNDCECHSVTDIKITYVDESGIHHPVGIPDIDEMFETREDMIKTITESYEKYLSAYKED